jgi:hypothetical protein
MGPGADTRPLPNTPTRLQRDLLAKRANDNAESVLRGARSRYKLRSPTATIRRVSAGDFPLQVMRIFFGVGFHSNRPSL